MNVGNLNTVNNSVLEYFSSCCIKISKRSMRFLVMFSLLFFIFEATYGDDKGCPDNYVACDNYCKYTMNTLCGYCDDGTCATNGIKCLTTRCEAGKYPCK
ncbi:hypothetical protein C1645_773182 [Glomus cerebriforme]|uniref:Uncharacterized protein n=1 Tax=Glomus cerebriforme TaxID=658196 RepID=A0A397STU9_9GLOM|nr:hypothetical protein C1645_773182 [Glomus cerebriforme]